jgi:glutamyl-tRNA(Gln) amidotransferase subunit E
VDPAALFEFHKGKQITYQSDPETTCLVELDEEPPHPLTREAVDTALTISQLLKAKALDEIHVMRKVVIDGSNTTGFQRTIVMALDGSLAVDGKDVPIEQVTLEEDAGRKIGETKQSVTFRLDRLGVPLIEISTGPVIKTPEEAGRTALAIGRILRATKQVKRGLGSIRQDLNISIKNGALVEIKGVQELELVSKVVELEAQRQLTLIGIQDELRQRNVKESDLKEDFIDVTTLLSDSQSKIVQTALKQGGKASAVRLHGFKGLLKRELVPGIRLGTEMAKRAAFWGKVGGIFHSDELPNYGIDQAHANAVGERLGCKDMDGFVIIADQEDSVLDGLNAVVERAREAVHKVPEETRVANPDGTTHYMRPRPGAARMYPETDVPPVPIIPTRLEEIREHLPRMPEEIARELASKFSLSPKLAGQLVDSEYLPAFEGIVASTKGVAPSYVATVLTESLKSLSRENVPVDNLQEKHLNQVFDLIAEGATAKESAVEILKWLSTHPESNASDAIKQLNLGMLSRDELENIISKVIASQQTLLEQQGSKAISKLMNLVMSEVRGRADPRTVNEMLKTRVE